MNIGHHTLKIKGERAVGVIIVAVVVAVLVILLGTTALWCRRQYQKKMIERQLARANSQEQDTGFLCCLSRKQELQHDTDKDGPSSGPDYQAAYDIERLGALKKNQR